MSRRSKSSSNGKNGVGNGGPPPSFAQEHYPEHRQFLVRSLDRNDTDMAAVMELNRSLKQCKAEIIEECGEIVLLDLGAGVWELNSTNTGLEPAEPDASVELPPRPDLCVDFLLRLKLRRKLLNRLARRLARLAHAMDGEDVTPPAPPKYGDLRLHIDDAQVEEAARIWQRQQFAREKLELQRETTFGTAPTAELPASPESSKSHDAVKPKEPSAEPKLEASEPSKEEPDTSETKPAAIASGTEAVPTTADEDKPEATRSTDATAEAAEKQDAESDGESEEPETRHGIDWEALLEYDDAYEKIWDPVSQTYSYTILNDTKHQADHMAIKYGAGIGASHRSMSAKEKEAEWKRWQGALLAKIPEQPTFADLGLKNRVFLLEERRKLAMEEEKASPKKKRALSGADEDEAATPKSKGKDEGTPKSKGKDGTPMDVDEKDGDEEMKEAEKEGHDEGKGDEDKAETSPSKKAKIEAEEEEEDHEKKKEAMVQRMKPMSLAAIPSFYEQDLKRIKLVHSELMATSMQDHARRRLEEVTRDYNKALRMSTELYERRAYRQNQLNSFMYESRTQTSKATNDYNVQLAVAKNNWHQRRKQFEHQKLDKLLPSRWGRIPQGSPATSNCKIHHDQISGPVATCLADVIDSVDLIATGQVQNHVFTEPFVPPAKPSWLSDAIADEATGETVAQRNQRVEQSLRNELSDLSTRLRTSEEERQRAWKKMLKTKAEFDLPHHSHAGRPMDRNAYSMMPLPSLRSSHQQNIPQEVASRPNYASYVPARQRPSLPPAGTHTSESKYSAARVRERIAADGTVAPVTEPKKTKDGLYQRPAGRTRKGMEWDALRGIWVPAPQQQQEQPH